ncbi:MAG: response regulator, partial [Nitrospira sp.]|nr:response regulator [Nitrospira sp.]
MAGAITDIAEQKQAQEAVKNAKNLLQDVIDSSPDWIFVKDLAHRFLLVNESFARAQNLSPRQMIGRPDTDFWSQELCLGDPEKGLRGFHEDDKEAFRGQLVHNTNDPATHADGSLHVFDTYKGPLRNEAGRVYGVLCYSRDVTERRKIEEALRSSEARLQEAQRLAHIGSWELDLRRNSLVWSEEIYRIFEIDQAAFGASYEAFLKLVHPDDRAMVDKAYTDSVANRTPYEVSHRLLMPDGRVKFVVERGETSYARDGSPERSLGTVQDMTESRQIQEQLLQGQKMEAVGRLAGGIAHEFNNLLTAINGYADLLLRRLGAESVERRYAKGIKESGERAAALTSQLLTFGQRQIVQSTIVNVNAIVAKAAEMLQWAIGEDMHLVTTLYPAIGLVKADAGQLEQVLMDLAVYARQTMPTGGTLTIETMNVWGVEPMVRVIVQDSGAGLDEQTRARIFEPFFSTKKMEKGGGVGLASVYGIVRQSGGTIEVDSVSGQGTRFVISLPLVDAAGQAAETKPVVRAAETILLVEDAAVVREFAREVLAEQGYRVMEAENAHEALQASAAFQGPIHLLLTDVVMPGMNGRQLADELKTLRPDTKVLFMSGYTEDAILRSGIQRHAVAFLRKPYNASVLTRAVREVLDASSEDYGQSH